MFCGREDKKDTGYTDVSDVDGTEACDKCAYVRSIRACMCVVSTSS